MPSPTICTVITRSFLAHARALTKSVHQFHPDAKVYVLLADKTEGLDPKSEPFELIPLETLADAGTVHRMCFYYTAFELCNALKPFLLEHVLKAENLSQAIYLDSDIFVFGALDPILSALAKHPILLSPHRRSAIKEPPIEDEESIERRLLRWGVYNGGFVAVTKSKEGMSFLSWWKEHLVRECLEKESGLFVDQLWLNLVPSLFPSTGILRHGGINRGYWNLNEGTLEKTPQGFLFGGEPLVFVHFSGWDIQNPTHVTRHTRRFDQATVAAWPEIGRTYEQALLACGHEQARALPYGFSQFSTGQHITPEMRRAFLREVERGVTSNVSPFDRVQDFTLQRPGTLRRIAGSIKRRVQ